MMNSKLSIKKRLPQNPTHRFKNLSSHFFLIVPIGLEEAAQNELLEWSGVLSSEFGEDARVSRLSVVKGGIEFHIHSPVVGYLFNTCLKIPSRILQRIHSFQTRDWTILENELKRVAWKDYFPEGISDWEIAASASRINNEKHLIDFLKEKFENKFYLKSPTSPSSPSSEPSPSSASPGISAYLRVHDNIFTLSRDTSGEHLHLRGYRQWQGEAPIRENLAAFLWYLLIMKTSRGEAEDALIVDPFVGSGTLLIEAMLWNQLVLGREFPFWAWIDEKSKEKFSKLKQRLETWNLNYLAVDINSEMLNKLNLNLSSNSKFKSPFKNELPKSSLTCLQGDSCHMSPSQLDKIKLVQKNRPIWLVSNPPYGGKGRMKSEKSWRKLWEGALRTYQPQWAVAVGPERECKKGDVIDRWKCLETHRFLNGGIRVIASVWKG